MGYILDNSFPKKWVSTSSEVYETGMFWSYFMYLTDANKADQNAIKELEIGDLLTLSSGRMIKRVDNHIASGRLHILIR